MSAGPWLTAPHGHGVLRFGGAPLLRPGTGARPLVGGLALVCFGKALLVGRSCRWCSLPPPGGHMSPREIPAGRRMAHLLLRLAMG